MDILDVVLFLLLLVGILSVLGLIADTLAWWFEDLD